MSEENDAIDSIVHLAKQYTDDEWEAAILVSEPRSIMAEAARALRWVHLASASGLPAMQRTPGSRLATEATGEAEVYINTLRFVVAPGEYTGRDVRCFMHPPLGDEHVLWMERVEGDEFIEDADTVTVKDGTKFYSAPRYINGG